MDTENEVEQLRALLALLDAKRKAYQDANFHAEASRLLQAGDFIAAVIAKFHEQQS